MNLHHMGPDGWSMDIPMEDLATLYNGVFVTTKQPEPRRIIYADFAQWWKSVWKGLILDMPGLLEECSFWSSRHDHLLQTGPDRSGKLFSGARFPFSLDQGATNGLKKLGNQESQHSIYGCSSRAGCSH